MNDLHIALTLLNLTKQETQLLLTLYLIHENESDKKEFRIEEIGKLVGLSKLSVEDTLNKLVMRNIIGRITHESITSDSIRENFNEEFLAILYDKKDPFKSALQKSHFYIENIEKYYFLNTVIKSWKFTPKMQVVSKLKKLKKAIDSKFIDYLLEGFNNGKAFDKRSKAHANLNGWNIKQVVEIFKSRYKVAYGNSYDAGTRDYVHMKKLLVQLSNDSLPKDSIGPFFDYAFERAVGRDYVLQIAGLKYYANEYSANVIKNKTGAK